MAAPSHRVQRGKDRAQAFNHWRVAANHQAVALVQPPHPTASSAIDIVDLFVGEPLCTTQRVLVVGIATIDESVTCRQQRQQLGDDWINRLDRNHQPQCARGLHRRHQRLQRSSGFGALGLDTFARLLFPGIADHAMATAHQPLRHVRAHAPQADHAECHVHRLVFDL
jgi:hypothetical protein